MAHACLAIAASNGRCRACDEAMERVICCTPHLTPACAGSGIVTSSSFPFPLLPLTWACRARARFEVSEASWARQIRA